MHSVSKGESDMTRTVGCWNNRTFAFETWSTVLIVIDMQRDFLADDGCLPKMFKWDNSPLRAVVPNVRSILEAARDAGLLVVHTREGYLPDGSDVTPAKREMGYVGAPGPYGPYLVRGSAGHDFLAGFEPAAGELVVDKAAFNAFHNTQLGETLADRAISHLLITGVTTQCCVHSTLRDAVDRGYLCLTVSDGCGALKQEWHDATMTIIQAESNLFGWIAESANVISALTQRQALAGDAG